MRYNLGSMNNHPKKARSKANLKRRFFRDRYLLIMLIPVILYYVIFCYLPMTGLIMAFNQYRIPSVL